MLTQEEVVRQLEDFILAEHNLLSVGNIPFEHHGKIEKGYPYIRASNASLLNAFQVVEGALGKPLNEAQFLEIGCGIGTKCELARQTGMSATGVDLLAEYVALARRVYPLCSFVHANALELDYCTFDIVYYHVPFFGDELVRELEQRLLQQLPLGSMLIVTRISDWLVGMLQAPQQNDRFQQISTNVDLGRLKLLRKISGAFSISC
ncbi:MAG: methyltransferase domain-containing protein [Planctomycetales bacterium]|nr:methyltransferase domain-containing protein [Planctomycetales bacterium]